MNPTSSAEWKKDYEHLSTEFQRIRDEIRVFLHLGKMDAKDEWHKLEAELEQLPSTIEAATAESCAAVASAVRRLKNFRKSLPDA
jgi:hypothetical protein